MKKISREEVKNIAKLADLPLTESELDLFQRQLSEVIDYNMNLLDEVNTENVKPTDHVTGLENIMREDNAEISLSVEEALSNTDFQYNQFFKVKRVLDKD